MTDTITEARALAERLDYAMPLNVNPADVAHAIRAIIAELEAARAELAAARAAMPSEDTATLVGMAVNVSPLSGASRAQVRVWISRLGDYHAAHPAASPAAEMSDAEFVAAVDAIIAEPEMQELLAMDRAAPDLPEPCARCSGSGFVDVPTKSGGMWREPCHACNGTRRADGGEVQNG